MITTHNLGFLRIGAKRELKFALASYGKGETPRSERKALGYNCASAIGSSRLTWIGHQWVTSLFMTKCWI